MELTVIPLTNILLASLVTFYLLLLVFMLTWVYHDAEQRGVNGWLMVGIAFFTGTITGILGWLILRPKLQPQPIPVGK